MFVMAPKVYIKSPMSKWRGTDKCLSTISTLSFRIRMCSYTNQHVPCSKYLAASFLVARELPDSVFLAARYHGLLTGVVESGAFLLQP